jgi:hypothetical protein
MPLLNYQDVGVSINHNNVGTTYLQANNASISFSVPIEPVRALGQKNSIAEIPSGPPEGSIQIDYIVIGSDPGRSIFESYVNLANTPSNIRTSITIGGRTFPSGYLTSYSISAEPNSIINASLSFNVYGEFNFNELVSSQNPAIPSPSIAHGSKTSITEGSTVLTDAIGFDYSASIDWTPIFVLNNPNAILVNYGGAQETLAVRGNNIAKAVTACPGSADTVNVNIRSICAGASIATITMTNAKVQDSELTVQAGGFVEGTYTLLKTY